MLSLEKKLQDPYYKKMYDKSNEVYELIRPYIFKSEKLLRYLSVIRVNALLEEENEDKSLKGLLNYYKYDVGNWVLDRNEEKEGGKLNKALIESLKEDFSNKNLNISIFQYETMEQLETEDYIKLLTKTFYLIDKYSDSPFSKTMLKYLNTINHYEDYKPKKEVDRNKEVKTEEDLKLLQEHVAYLKLQNNYMRIMSLFREYLEGFNFSKARIRERVELYLTDYFYLYQYKAHIDRFNATGLEELQVSKDDIVKPLEIKFKNIVDRSKDIYELREELEDFLKDVAKENNIDITLTPVEEKIIQAKMDEASNVLEKFNYKYLDHINFNTITYLLAFNEETKEWLKDANSDLSLENPLTFEEEKEEVNIEEVAKNVVKGLAQQKEREEKSVFNELDREEDTKQDIPVKETTKKGHNSKIKPKKATLEEINEAYEQKAKEYYKTNSTPTNIAILDTYGAYSGIETNSLDKINIKLNELTKKLKSAKTKEAKENIQAEIDLLEQKKDKEEELYKNLVESVESKEENIKQLNNILEEKKDQLNRSEIEQYESTLNSLRTDLLEAKDDLDNFNSRGLAFRGNIFNELEYNDEKGNIIATIRNKDGQPLDPKDTPILADAFLRVTNDLYFNRYDMLKEYSNEKIDLLFPLDRGGSFRIANETIKRNLGKNGFIINVKDLLKLLGLSENSFKYFGTKIEEAIKFYNNMEISVQQKDKITQNEDVLNMFFGITSNVHLSRQVDNNYYIYFEISSIYETILNNAKNPTIAQYPKELLKYTTGQKGSKRVFKVGEKLYTLLRNSLNGSNGGVKIDENGNYYKNVRVRDLLRPLRESKLINRQARPRKYREDVFNPLIMVLDTLEEEKLIEYTLYFDDSVYMSNDTFKTTFETSLIKITYLKTSEDYENILAKNLQNKKKSNVNNAKDFVLEWGKYKGKTLGEILEEDKQYLEWILNEKDLKIKKPKVTRQHIKNLLAYEKDLEKLKD